MYDEDEEDDVVALRRRRRRWSLSLLTAADGLSSEETRDRKGFSHSEIERKDILKNNRQLLFLLE